MHGAVMLDASDEVVRPALIWCDVRTEKQCRDLTEKIGAEELIQLTCNPALPNFTLTKFLWVRENEPENWKRVRSVMLPKDYVRFRLTGELATDMADASGTLLLDVANRRWSHEVLQAAGIEESLLPRLFESPEVCGKVSAAGAAATGLQPGTPVVAGAGDQAAGAVGMGIATPGAVSATIGTSGVVFAATDRPALDPKGRLHTFCHAVPGRWHVMGVTQAAGLSLRWFRDRSALGRMKAWPRSLRAAYGRSCRRPAGIRRTLVGSILDGRTHTASGSKRARGVDWVDRVAHARSCGPRDSRRSGVQFERLLHTFRGDECARRNHPAGRRRGEVSVVAADSSGRLWTEVEIVEAEEGAAYGAAILAGVGAGMWSSVDAACSAVVRVAQRVAPQPAVVERMNTQLCCLPPDVSGDCVSFRIGRWEQGMRRRKKSWCKALKICISLILSTSLLLACGWWATANAIPLEIRSSFNVPRGIV